MFLTGSDTASNALFGSLQRITAEQLHLNPILAAATNSTGGVMGKMIDAQSITVATAACYEDAREGAHALGPIFRRVFWFSVMGAAFIGLILTKFSPLGIADDEGIRRWLKLGPVTFQVSELAKIALIGMVAHYWSTLSLRERRGTRYCV